MFMLFGGLRLKRTCERVIENVCSIIIIKIHEKIKFSVSK